MFCRRDLLKAGVGLAGAVARGIGCSRAYAEADDPVAESDPIARIRRLGPVFDEAPLGVQPLTDSLSLVEGPGGNILVHVGPEGTILIDTGVASRSRDVQATARRLNRGDIVSFVVNTHWHPDHTGGNQALGVSGAKIWSTANCRIRLENDQFIPDLQTRVPAMPQQGRPRKDVRNEPFGLRDDNIQFVPVAPAHTDGDLIVHFLRANVIHAGDLFINGGYPYIDASSRGWLGGMIAAADLLLSLSNPRTRIIPGHGPLASPEQLAAYRQVLVTTYDRIAPMIDAGKSVDDVIKARPTKEFDAVWGQGFLNGPTFTRIAYSGIVAHRRE